MTVVLRKHSLHEMGVEVDAFDNQGVALLQVLFDHRLQVTLYYLALLGVPFNV